jgi:hypothetical protein
MTEQVTPAVTPVVSETPSQTATVAPGATQEATPESQANAARFAVLAKKERALRAQQESLKAQMAEIQRKAAEVEAFEKSKLTAKQNPLEVLKNLGLSYDELTQFVINGEKATPELAVRAVKDELEAFKAEQAEARRRAEEAEKVRLEQERSAVLDRFRQEVAQYVTDNREKYELLNLYGQEGLVSEVIQQHFEQTQRIMSNEEAADRAEKYLEELVQKAQATKKFGSKAVPQPQGEVAPANVSAQPRTLTNEMSASTPSLVNSPQTEAERFKRALAALEKAGKTA